VSQFNLALRRKLRAVEQMPKIVFETTLVRHTKQEPLGLGLDSPDANGFLLLGIKPGSPAGRCGALEINDRIVAVGGRPVSGDSDFAELLASNGPGLYVTLEILRTLSSSSGAATAKTATEHPGGKQQQQLPDWTPPVGRSKGRSAAGLGSSSDPSMPQGRGLLPAQSTLHPRTAQSEPMPRPAAEKVVHGSPPSIVGHICSSSAPIINVEPLSPSSAGKAALRRVRTDGPRLSTDGGASTATAGSADLPPMPYANVTVQHEQVPKPLVQNLRVTLERDAYEGFGMGIGFDGGEAHLTGAPLALPLAVISGIGEGTPAMRCGQLRKGDRVVAINGRTVSDLSDLGALKEVTTVTFDITRIVDLGEPSIHAMASQVKLAAMTAPMADSSSPSSAHRRNGCEQGAGVVGGRASEEAMHEVPRLVLVDVHEMVRAPELVVTMEDVALVAATKVEETIENVVKVAFTATRAIISPIGHVFQKVWGGAPEVGEALCAGPRVRPALQQEPSADLHQSSPLRIVRPSTRRDSPWVEPPLRSLSPPGLELQVSTDADWVSIDQKPPPSPQKPSSPLPKPPRGSRPLTPPLVEKSPPVPAPAMKGLKASCCWALAREVANVTVWCFIYFGTGAAFYMHVEGWNIWQSLYFLMVTASSVGYGDLKPNPHGWESRAFTVVYIIFGVCVVFALLSSLITKCVVKPFIDSSRAALERRFPQSAIDLDGTGVLVKVPRTPFCYYGKNLAIPLIMVVVIQCLFAWVFCIIEGWDFETSFYHCINTMATVGYGDVAINGDPGRMWAFFHIAISVSILSAIYADVRTLQQKRAEASHKMKMIQGSLDVNLMMSLDKNGDGVDKFEFVTGMLALLNAVKQDDVDVFVKLFKVLDVDSSGTLTKDDIQEGLAARQKQFDSMENIFEAGSVIDRADLAVFGPRAPSPLDAYNIAMLRRGGANTASSSSTLQG